MTTHEYSVESPDKRLKVLASLCGTGTCPTVYSADATSVIVQGYAVTGDEGSLDVPDGEHLVRIPTEVLLAAADAIRKQA
ncbi:hypothetical protein Aab01nite_38920 [Paractinoplanes abujensis]|uniref:Uncharacterized protein n=1 Tax=Paractinoplanes abujensis TaxID=882441 RepID=A0A7W7CTN1_9ACTN|nr:hypothetical protein [Actinoplanes abujensis]MBB4694484.1 hypothetical protein [Actinoplanes abujensis]GID20302.1 hypothetical protein Aab01nite_38920 [Actinoplanes abujensis]